MIRVAIDCFWIDKPRGLGRYLREVLNALSKWKPAGVEIYALAPSGVKGRSDLIWPGINYVFCPSFPYPIWENVVVPVFARRAGVDVVHSPNNTAPFFWQAGLPWVVTIHDLIYLNALGVNWYQRFGNILRRISLFSIRRRGIKVLTVSRASALVIKSEINLASDVAYTPCETLDFSEVIDKGSSSFKTILHVGGEAEHKNTKRVVEAFLSLNLPDVKLVVLGLSNTSELALNY